MLVNWSIYAEPYNLCDFFSHLFICTHQSACLSAYGNLSNSNALLNHLKVVHLPLFIYTYFPFIFTPTIRSAAISWIKDSLTLERVKPYAANKREKKKQILSHHLM